MEHQVPKMSHGSSFSSFSFYLRALSQTPQRLQERMPIVWTAKEELTEVRARSGAEMKRNLQWYDAVALGVGGMLGAGVFITTGKVALSHTGPSIVVAYAIAGFSALLSACCYTEFSVEVPVAGGAFSYLRVTFGEFAAYMTGANLLMEYVVSNAAVARSFTSYFSSVFGVVNGDAWRVKVSGFHEGYNMLDFTAVLLLALLTIFICYSTKESSIFNMVITLFHLLFMIFIVVSSFVNGNLDNFHKPADPSNRSGFAPYGAKGIFNGAAIVYFSYIGYDAVSTMAEEVRFPARGMPIGVAGSVIIVSLLYCLMGAALSALVPYDKIDPNAPFSMAFRHIRGWSWASNVVGMGASLGIVTSLLVAMLGQARYMCVIGRSNLIPKWFARVNPKTGTPVNATVFLGCLTAIISLFTELQILIDLVSIGTLFVFYMVANALIYRRYVLVEMKSRRVTVWFLILMSMSSIGNTVCWHQQEWWIAAVFGACSIILTVVFHVIIRRGGRTASSMRWCVPLMPWSAALSIFLSIFLVGSLEKVCFERFGVWTLISIVFYVLYGLHASHDADQLLKESAKPHVSLASLGGGGDIAIVNIIEEKGFSSSSTSSSASTSSSSFSSSSPLNTFIQEDNDVPL